MDLYLPTHHLDADLGRDALLDREWLLTNGTGAYSMGTALGCNTRRYHGLLVAATKPPVGRVVVLSQVIDELTLPNPGDADDDELPLATCLFGGGDGDDRPVHHPGGNATLAAFERGVAAVWTYRGSFSEGAVEVRRELVLHWHEQAATLRYTVTGDALATRDAELRVAPMLMLRDFHGLLHRDEAPSFELSVEPHGQTATFRRGGTSATLHCPTGRFRAEPDWWYGLAYPVDTRRGQGDREDAFVPGAFVVPLRKGSQQHVVEVTAALGTSSAAPDRPHARVKHLRPMLDRLPGDAERRTTLAIAADDFVVERAAKGKALSTVLAGYPWFADWGRDTFIALPGLLLCAGRLDEAERVLRAFAGSLRGGLVPNRFDDYDADAAEYNTVDASLWFVHAGLEYLAAAGKSRDAKAGWLRKAMREVVDGYAAGTTADSHEGEPLPIRTDGDGLITAGHDASQLTWMDAAHGGVVFTPRPGKCVEINALWHHGLAGLADVLAPTDPEAAQRYRDLAARVAAAFVATFCRDGEDGLIDHVRPDGTADGAVRPNQVFAVSLARSPLPEGRKQGVIDTVKRHLLTPVGLRTLPPGDADYHPRYAGPQADRDGAYHRGTVWPWLIGPYAEAVLRAGRFGKPARADARAAIAPLLEHLAGAGLGQLPELFDADPVSPGAATHAPKGTPAQAWSVAEVLRVLTLIESA